MTKPRARLILLALALIGVSGCGRLSKIENETAQALVVRYWHKDYDRWSPTMKAGPRGAIHVPPGHHFGDVSCLEITDGPKRLIYDNAALRGVQTLCQKTQTCTIRYRGAGRLSVRGAGQAADQTHTLPSDKLCRT